MVLRNGERVRRSAGIRFLYRQRVKKAHGTNSAEVWLCEQR